MLDPQIAPFLNPLTLAITRNKKKIKKHKRLIWTQNGNLLKTTQKRLPQPDAGAHLGVKRVVETGRCPDLDTD